MADLMAALEEALGIAEQDRLYGFGAPRVVSVSPPRVGFELSIALPSVGAVRILSLFATLTTTAVVAGRRPTFSMVGPSGLTIAQFGTSTAQTASGFWQQSFAPALNYGLLNGSALTGPLPDLWLPPGSKITTQTFNIDAGDQWSGVTYVAQYR